MRQLTMLLSLATLAAAGQTVSKIDPATDPIRPGTKVKFTLTAAVAADTPVTLFVDKKASALPPLKVGAGKEDVTFEIDKKTFDAIKTAGKHELSIGPAAGPPFAGGMQFSFEPPPAPGVISYSVRRWRWAEFKDKCQGTKPPGDCWARLGDSIELLVDDDAYAPLKGGEVLMFIDGRPMPGVTGSFAGSAGGISTLVFDWDPSIPSQEAAKAGWLRILRDPWKERVFALSMGAAAGPPLPTKITSFPIQRISRTWLLLWAGFFAGAALFMLYAIRRGLLLEEVEAFDGQGERAYSLARTQMAAWTFIVAMAIAYIWMVTWNEDVLNPSVLLLIGISSATTLSAVVVDANKKTAATNLLSASGITVPPPPGNPAAAPAKAPPTSANTDIAAAIAVHTTPKRENFLLDLISDRNGPAVGRVQMLLFTVILMIIFVIETARTLVMPAFPETLLLLMGISSAGYLAFKVPEKKS